MTPEQERGTRALGIDACREIGKARTRYVMAKRSGDPEEARKALEARDAIEAKHGVEIKRSRKQSATDAQVRDRQLSLTAHLKAEAVA